MNTLSEKNGVIQHFLPKSKIHLLKTTLKDGMFCSELCEQKHFTILSFPDMLAAYSLC